MDLLSEVKILVRKEVVLEWRSKYALNGILLYVVSTIFVCYLSLRQTDPLTWNALFWIIMLFASINAIAKSFIQETRGRQLYYYTVASPQAIILSKIIYNALLLIILAIMALTIYSAVFENTVGNPALYFFGVLIGSLSFSTVFTMISAIASRAGNNGTLMAILSFPVIIPLLILLIKLSKNAMLGYNAGSSLPEIIILTVINVMVVTVSLLLFPYLWKD